MTAEPTSSPPEGQGTQSAPEPARPSVPERKAPRLTRASAAWVATAAALLLLILLIIFILQNSGHVEVHYLGVAGSLPLGMALFIAAVGGGVAVAIAGVARVTQLRINARRIRQNTSAPDSRSEDRP